MNKTIPAVAAARAAKPSWLSKPAPADDEFDGDDE